jgi:hypothetical protein
MNLPKSMGVEDFWSRVNIGAPDECWEWKDARHNQGYGRLGDSAYTHRIAWELTHGPIPSGSVIMHRCDNPPCCNPNHIQVATQGDNIRDCSAKGRLNSYNSRKTHCPNGHPYAGDNLIVISTNGRRKCRACKREQNRRYKERRAA